MIQFPVCQKNTEKAAEYVVPVWPPTHETVATGGGVTTCASVGAATGRGEGGTGCSLLAQATRRTKTPPNRVRLAPPIRIPRGGTASEINAMASIFSTPGATIDVTGLVQA
jgi:hypothetical protein